MDWKIFTKPIVPIVLSKSVSLDLVFILAVLLLCAFTAFLIMHLKTKKTIFRRFTQVSALLIFGLFFSQCMCMAKSLTVATEKITLGLVALMFFYLWLPLIILGFVIVYSRQFYCYWLCPLGLVQDVSGKVEDVKKRMFKKEILKYMDIGIISISLIIYVILAWIFMPSPLLFGSGAALGLILLLVIPILTFKPDLEKKFRNLKYIILVLWVVLAFYLTSINLKASGPWCVLGVANYTYPAIFPFIAIIIGAMVLPRAWCRFLCPDGALFQLVDKVKRRKKKETDPEFVD